jgi:hypothetical protein
MTASSSNQSLTKIPGVVRATPRSHGRTSDLLAGGLQRHNTTGESLLWVCHFCFKYMAEGGPWELHKVCYRGPSLQFLTNIDILSKKDCKMKHPPGKKVYQRGAHIIWEVDGAREKVSSNLLTVEMTSSKCTSSFTAKIYHSSENYSSMSRLYFLIVTIVRNPPLLYFRLPLSKIFDSSILHPHRRQIVGRPYFRVLLQGLSNTLFIGRVLRRNFRKNYPMTTTTLPAL